MPFTKLHPTPHIFTIPPFSAWVCVYDRYACDVSKQEAETTKELIFSQFWKTRLSPQCLRFLLISGQKERSRKFREIVFLFSIVQVHQNIHVLFGANLVTLRGTKRHWTKGFHTSPVSVKIVDADVKSLTLASNSTQDPMEGVKTKAKSIPDVVSAHDVKILTQRHLCENPEM